jgi:CubicO group peptidase (beta-lactamase class C family)
MNKINYTLISIGVICLLTSCKQNIKTEIELNEFPNKVHYVSIDGIWRVTPETAIKFPHGTLEPIILISGDAQGDLKARGCFLWDGHFYDYWEYDSVLYIDSTNQLVIADIEGGIYKGLVDEKKEVIRGIAQWDEEDTSDTATLEFFRDEDIDLNRLFIPYPPGPDGSIKYTYQQPEYHNDQLQTASIFDFVVDPKAFYKVIERIIKQKFGRLESFLVIKDQKLILEEYFYGYDRTQLHNIHSCTKSITSLLLGISLDRHKKLNVDQPLFNFFPQYNSIKTSDKDQITLKHVLTMTAGFGEGEDSEDPVPDDVIQNILSRPMESNPGEKFRYDNECTNLLGGIIHTLEKKQADEFAEEVLFNKLCISEYYWEKENGVLHCHSDLHMKSRDMAKIGLLVLNKGYWNGEQIVPEEWIDISTQPHVAETEFFDYGYQWWYRSKRNTPWWENPVLGGKEENDMFHARGYGGQYIMIIEDMNMVIVVTASDYNESNGMANIKVPMVIEELVPLFY